MTKRPIVWLNGALTAPAGLSLWYGVRHGLERGQDFQWSGAHLAAMGVDPYRQYLIGDPQHRIIMAQVPNYLHELYLLLLPLGDLRFPTARALWLVLNLLLLAVVVWSLHRIYALPKAETVLLLLLTVCSAPFRIVLGNGQQSLLELLLFCLVFLLRGTAGRGAALGLSYAKYSFAPVLVIYLLLRRRLRLLLVSSLPVIAGLAGLWALVGGSLPVLAAEPLAVSRTGVTPGLGDSMSLVWAAAGSRVPAAAERNLMYGVALALSLGCALYAGKRAQRSGEATAAAMLAVAGLLCFTHLTYDYVFLMVPLAAGLRQRAGRHAQAAACIVACLWLLLALSGRVPDRSIPILQVSVFCVLGTIFLLLGATREPTPTESAEAAASGGASRRRTHLGGSDQRTSL